jgi:hypothetical protein
MDFQQFQVPVVKITMLDPGTVPLENMGNMERQPWRLVAISH